MHTITLNGKRITVYTNGYDLEAVASGGELEMAVLAATLQRHGWQTSLMEYRDVITDRRQWQVNAVMQPIAIATRLNDEALITWWPDRIELYREGITQTQRPPSEDAFLEILSRY